MTDEKKLTSRVCGLGPGDRELTEKLEDKMLAALAQERAAGMNPGYVVCAAANVMMDMLMAAPTDQLRNEYLSVIVIALGENFGQTVTVVLGQPPAKAGKENVH